MSSSLPPGVFLPANTTYSEDQSQRLLQHTKFAADTARYMNLKEVAIYDLTEIQTAQQWFNPGNNQVKRFGFRRVFSFNDASLTFNHGITGITLCTYIGGAFTDGTKFYPLPYVSTAIANQVQIQVTSTQVLITKGGTAPAITTGVVVLEYLKQ
jgi:hypothetical protein